MALIVYVLTCLYVSYLLQEQLNAAILLLQTLVTARERTHQIECIQCNGNNSNGSSSSSPPSGPRKEIVQDLDSEDNGSMLGPQDSHFYHTILTRARAIQQHFRKLTHDDAVNALAGDTLEPNSSLLGDRFQQNERLTSLFVR